MTNTYILLLACAIKHHSYIENNALHLWMVSDGTREKKYGYYF